ncbi:Holliday junction branch migration protein RuvA, partial [Candidatus Woesebacteria bacterium]|nr:Holliday junction branch migration protein RuvA [Candidatus Woesebacteria bacterium]
TVVDALMALGYKSQEAKQALSKISKGLSIEEKIKEALKNTATKK